MKGFPTFSVWWPGGKPNGKAFPDSPEAGVTHQHRSFLVLVPPHYLLCIGVSPRDLHWFHSDITKLEQWRYWQLGQLGRGPCGKGTSQRKTIIYCYLEKETHPQTGHFPLLRLLSRGHGDSFKTCNSWMLAFCRTRTVQYLGRRRNSAQVPGYGAIMVVWPSSSDQGVFS